MTLCLPVLWRYSTNLRMTSHKHTSALVNSSFKSACTVHLGNVFECCNISRKQHVCIPSHSCKYKIRDTSIVKKWITFHRHEHVGQRDWLAPSYITHKSYRCLQYASSAGLNMRRCSCTTQEAGYCTNLCEKE